MIFLNYVSKLFAGMKVEKHRDLSVVLTMIASFSLAFAYLYWQRIVSQRAPGRQSTAIAAPVPVPGERTRPSMPAVSRSSIIPQEKSQVHPAPAAEVTPAGSADD